ncbi:MAG: PleD family two-component system response regulator [Maricaulaceae bacterium]|jgi:two-component system cell cycle response regulator
MAGRILVADDHEPNRRLLQARLETEYFDVVTANDGVEAIEATKTHSPDLILMDVMMPRMDGYEATRIIKQDPAHSHVPIVMVTALDQPEDRVRGLEAGADDFLTKPIDDVILFARVRSLLRLKSVMDELRSRRQSGREIGVIAEGDGVNPAVDVAEGSRILVVDDPGRIGERLVERLSERHHPQLETDPRRAVAAARGPWDLIILDLKARSFDGLRLAARLRSDEATRRLPVLAIVDEADRDRLVRALDIGVNDVLSSPSDAQELDARVRTLVKRKRYADYLRASLDHSLEMAVTDQLTGLHNRRYLNSQLTELISSAHGEGKSVAVIIADIDHFKQINDAHGHDAGDVVLREFAGRLAINVRAIDAACRYGGEEFVVIMPDADLDAARSVAERIRRAVQDKPISAAKGVELDVTVSLGVASLEPGDDLNRLIKRADQALYAAKQRGRNRVVLARVKRPDAA